MLEILKVSKKIPWVTIAQRTLIAAEVTIAVLTPIVQIHRVGDRIQILKQLKKTIK